jgi:hypothetical protein
LGIGYEEYNQKILKLEREQISMGNNDYQYYNDSYSEESPAVNMINQEMNKNYKGEEGKIILVLFKFS